MTRDEWMALAERLETATGPDQEIDAAMRAAVAGGIYAASPVEIEITVRASNVIEAAGIKTVYGLIEYGAPRLLLQPNMGRVSIDQLASALRKNVSPDDAELFLQGAGTKDALSYTASIDAITALIERELSGAAWRLHKIPTASPTRATAEILLHYERRFHGDATNPALALCAAFCRAMAEKGERG